MKTQRIKHGRIVILLQMLKRRSNAIYLMEMSKFIARRIIRIT